MPGKRKMLGEIMVDQGYITLEHVNHARRLQMTSGGRLFGEWLVDLGHAASDHVRQALEIQQRADGTA